MAETTKTTAHFRPTLGLLDGTMIVAGSMIGSGIFIVSADITRNVGSAGWLLFVWLITGFMTISAAISYGELSAMYPKAGGQYIYLKEAYNPLTGFLYGWSFFAVIQTGTIAAVGVAFSKFAGYILPSLELKDENVLITLGSTKVYWAQIVSIILIIFLTWVNTRGIEGGKWIQRIFTFTKLFSLFGLIVLGLLIGASHAVWQHNWIGGWNIQRLIPAKDGSSIVGSSPLVGLAVFGAIAAAMTGSIFSSDAWNNVTFIAGEMKNPRRNIGLSLFLGTLIITIIYVSANLMYLSVMPVDRIATAPQDRVAVAAADVIFGHMGTYVIAIMIMISTFGCNNGLEIWRFAGHDLICGGFLLCHHGSRHLCAPPEAAIDGAALQGVRVSRAADHLHPAGDDILCGAYHSEAYVCRMGSCDRPAGNSFVLYSFVPQKSIKQCPISLNYLPVLARSGPG
jgi:APA family basic amino acid/polyamine antiporter